MRILISGSTGFLGQNLAKHIQSMRPEWKIFGFDLKETEGVDYDFEKLDFNSDINWKEKFKSVEPDIVFHLVGLFRGTQDDMYETNVSSFQRFIEGFHKADIESRLLVLGSSAQYGTFEKIDTPIKEEYPTNPTSIYGQTKNEQEQIALSFFENYELDIVCTRPASFIGKGVSNQLLSGYLNEKFYEHEKTIRIEISHPDDVRDYIDVRDTCSALILLSEMTGINGEIFNVSSNQPISNIDLIKNYEKIFGKRSIITFTDSERVPNKSWLDNAKMAKCCSYRPKYTIEDSIRSIFD
jgi:nucleoside-diphosphate-sugar epimerase